MTTGLHRGRFDGFGGFHSKGNNREGPTVHGSLPNGGSKWSSNIWEPSQPAAGFGRGSGSLVPSSEIDSWANQEPSVALSQPPSKRGYAFPSLQQAPSGRAPAFDRHSNGSPGNSYTTAGQSLTKSSSLDWQPRIGNVPVTALSNGHNIRRTPSGPGPLNNSLENGGGFGQSRASWADEDDSLFSPLDPRHSSSARQAQGSAGGRAPANGFPNGGFQSHRTGTNTKVSPWHPGGVAVPSDRSASLSNGIPPLTSQISKSASIPFDNSTIGPALTESFGRLNVSNSENFRENSRRHNSAFEGPFGPRMDPTVPHYPPRVHEGGTVYGRNGLETRRAVGMSGGPYGGPNASFGDASNFPPNLNSEESDFFPTYSADMARTSSSGSHGSNTRTRGNDIAPFQSNGSSLPQPFAASGNFMPYRGLPFASRQQQEQYLQYQWFAMQMRQQMHDPYAYTLPLEAPMGGYNPYLPMAHLQDPKSSSYTRPRPLPETDLEPGTSLRSELLEEFKANTGGKGFKKYELSDIYNHLVEFCGDREGSHFIQDELPTATSEQKERVFSEIRDNILPLMKDVFGNYVVQKFFQFGDQVQKKYMVGKMRGQIPELSLSVYGCRVVQTALEHVLVEQQAAMIWELRDQIATCIRDENGNHVLQKAIMAVPEEHITFLLDAMVGQIQNLSKHKYGCRVVQKMLKYCQSATQARVLREIHACSKGLISDEYGNYVPQHVIEHGNEKDRELIITVVMDNLIEFSRQKYASNVVEKCITFGTDQIRHDMLQHISSRDCRGESNLPLVLKDNYGNYVIQSLLDHLNDTDYVVLIRMIEPDIARDRRMNMSKQAENVARKMHRFDERFTYQNQHPPNILNPHARPTVKTFSSYPGGGSLAPPSIRLPTSKTPSTQDERIAEVDMPSSGVRNETSGVFAATAFD
ncbi:MAG: mRNA binding protein puf3 [Chrysothrix sp. TS-e1954]|nr:MAG: mRNA binding protein puf3 [Chrysothrix sp. TS-e1954]